MIEDDYSPINFPGNGSSTVVYPVPDFWFANKSQVRVFVDGVEIDFARIEGEGITTLDPQTEDVVIVRETALAQTRDFTNNGPLPSVEIEGLGDQLTKRAQEQAEILSRAPVFPPGASPEDFKNKTVGYNEKGETVVRTPEQEVEFLGIRPQLQEAVQRGQDASRQVSSIQNLITDASGNLPQDLLQAIVLARYTTRNVTQVADLDAEPKVEALYINEAIYLDRDVLKANGDAVIFGPKGKIVTNGFRFRCQPPVYADDRQHIFELTEPGQVYGKMGGVVRQVLWFGAHSVVGVGDSYANWLGIQSAIEATDEFVTHDYSGDGNSYGKTWATWSPTMDYHSLDNTIPQYTVPTGMRVLDRAKAKYYKCYLEHLASDASTEPGVGANWQNYWVDMGPPIIVRSRYSTEVRIPQRNFRIDRPLDLRNKYTQIKGPPGVNRPRFYINPDLDSVEFARPENMEFPEDYPLGTQVLIRVGCTALRQPGSYTHIKNESMYDQGIERVGFSTTRTAGMTAIWVEGSLEENCTFERLIIFATHYCIGGDRTVHTNGLVFDRLHLLGAGSGFKPIQFMTAGYGWSCTNATFIGVLGDTEFSARIGGKEFVMQEVHIEHAGVAAIDVCWNSFDRIPISNFGGGTPPNGTLQAINGFKCEGSIIRVSNPRATVACLAINRDDDNAPVIEDLNTGRSTTLNTDRMVASQARTSVAYYMRRGNAQGALRGYDVVTENLALQLPKATSGIIATGTTQSNAKQLNFEYNQVTVIPASGSGVRLPACRQNRRVSISNRGAGFSIKAYPSVGDDLGNGVDQPIAIGLNKTITFVGLSNDKWATF